MMATMTLFSNQNKEVAALDEKMALQGLQNQISSVLASPAFCKCFIGANTFDYTAAIKVWNGPNLISSSYDGACAPVGPAMLTVLAPITPRIRPVSMAMQNITEINVGLGEFTGDLTIGFDQTLLTRNRRAIVIPVFFKVKMTGPEPATARIIESCAPISSAPAVINAGLCSDMGGIFNAAAVPKCQLTYQ